MRMWLLKSIGAGALAGVVVLALGALAASALTAADAPTVDNSPAPPAKGPAPAKPDGKTWPLFRGDHEALGVTTAKLPDKLALKWRFKTGGFVKATAVIANGVAYIGSHDGKFYAIDVETGKQVWVFSTANGPPFSDSPRNKRSPAPIESPGCLIGDRVYFGDADGFFYCLDTKTGKMKWAFETMDKIIAGANWTRSPKGDAIWVIFGSHDGSLYCLNASTGKKVWSYQTESPINGLAAIAAGRTVFGGCDMLLHVLTVADGKPVMEIELGAYVPGTAALTKRYVYVGHHGNRFVCVDLDRKEIAWQFHEREFPFFASPAVGKDLAVIGGDDRRVHAVNRDTGKQKWEFKARAGVGSSPVIANNRVVVGSDDGRVYMLNLANGDKVWSYEIGQPITSSPAVIDGLVIIGSDDGYVYAFGRK